MDTPAYNKMDCKQGFKDIIKTIDKVEEKLILWPIFSRREITFQNEFISLPRKKKKLADFNTGNCEKYYTDTEDMRLD